MNPHILLSLILSATVIAICGWALVARGTRRPTYHKIEPERPWPKPNLDQLLAPYSPKCNICGKPATGIAYDEAICARCDALVTAFMRRRAG